MQFGHGVELIVTIEEFEPENHTIDTCHFQNQPYYCKIDGENWFGRDMGLELPSYELKEIVVVHKGMETALDVSQMFNPTFSLSISQRQFEVNVVNDELEVYAWFSDGAGTYCAKWLVRDGASKRTLLSNSEADCFE